MAVDEAKDLGVGPLTDFRARLDRLPRQRAAMPIVAIVILLLVGLGTQLTVQNAMEDMLAAKLQTILEADVTGLRIWLEEQKKVVDTVIVELEVQRSIRALVRLARTAGAETDALDRSDSLRALRETLGPVCRTHRYIDFLVVTPGGTNIGSIDKAYIGKRPFPDRCESFNKVLEGKTLITRPFRSLLPLPDEAGVLRSGIPSMSVAAPVYGREGTSVVAALAFLIRPARDFTSILNVGRPGQSGETYAFDAKGLMISESRFHAHLKQIGLLREEPGASSILNIEIKDPGGNLLKGFRPLPRSEQPLTLMAKDATKGRSGLNVDGYRDYRGVPVIGAWTWLGQYGFGVTTELDVAEAFRPVRMLRYVFGILFGLLLLATLGILFSARIISGLHLRMERMGQYTLERKLGKGGMGAVYLANHAMLRRPTAVKILRREHSNEEAMVRFEREVQITSQLTHLNTIRIYDYGRTPDGTFYYAMEFLPGVNLHTLVENTGPLGEARVIHILLQICASLVEAHSVGLIHRDIKPENVIIYSRGGDYDMVKVVDFGLVKYAAGGQGSGDPSYELPAGTPQYLSPEAIRTPGGIDERSDLYSVAAVGYFLLTGQDVFPGKSPIDICRRHLNDKPELPSERLGRPISTDLEDLIILCLEKDPHRRPKDASTLIEALESCADNGQWAQEEAKAWWNQVGDALVQEELLRGEVPETSASRMRVDLGKREELV
jgi:hypothetical protein